jgi:hypothetical protein
MAGLAPAQEPAGPELKLEYLPTTAPALSGHLGDPQQGLSLQTWRMLWHPGGRLFTSGSGPTTFENLLITFGPPRPRPHRRGAWGR